MGIKSATDVFWLALKWPQSHFLLLLFGDLQWNVSVLNSYLLYQRLGFIPVYLCAGFCRKKTCWGFFIWKMSIPVSHKREKILCLGIGMLLWPSFDLFMLWQNKSLHYGLFAVCTVNSISLCKLLWVTFFMVNKQTMVQCFQDFISVYSTITSVHFFVCRVHCGLAEITFISAEIRLKRQKHLGL